TRRRSAWWTACPRRTGRTARWSRSARRPSGGR
ncbi:MAG: hypothetical protein AVDCRST_MAG40-1564, partial [uncultured Gemmatimonadaceae bacterium]